MKAKSDATDIATIIETNPVAVLIDPKTYSQFYQHIKAETDAFLPDLSTITSRAKISAMAYKVTRSKTAIDAAGKKLNEDARAQINKVDEQRRKIRDELDALADEVRKPLTEWEEQEEKRKGDIADTMNLIDGLQRSWQVGSSDNIAEALARITAIEFDADIFQADLGTAITAKADAITSLEAALAKAIKYEADQAELERLRRENELHQIAENARLKDEQIERDRVATEQRRVEQDRQAELARQKAITDAAEKAKHDAEAQAAIVAEREKAKYQAIIDAAARDDRERQSEAKRLADEQIARDKDKAHRSAVMKAAKEAIMSNGSINEEAAKKIVLAIIASEIPNVRLTF